MNPIICTSLTCCVHVLIASRVPTYEAINTIYGLLSLLICSSWSVFIDSSGVLLFRISIRNTLKSCETPFVLNIHFSWAITLKICTEYGSITAVLCTNLQNDMTNKQLIMCEWDFTKFELKMHFVWINIAQSRWNLVALLHTYRWLSVTLHLQYWPNLDVPWYSRNPL